MEYNGIDENQTCGYNNVRLALAARVAEELGLKPFNPLLYEIAARKSDLPEKVYPDGSAMSMPEQSLLAMGMVYRYGGNLSVVDISGHTYIMPDHAVVREELKRCGYCICAYGSTIPEEIEKKHGDDRKSFEFEWDLKEYRKKYTLPEPLVEHISHIEWHYPFDNYKYDVFAPVLSKGNSNFGTHGELLPILETLGVSAPEVRKYLLACGNYGAPIEGIELITNLTDLIMTYRRGPILDNRLYFGTDGMAQAFRRAMKLREKQLIEAQEAAEKREEVVNSFLNS